MTIILDASMALAWHLERIEKSEANLAKQALQIVTNQGALVPALWFSEITNGLLVAERQRVSNEQEIALFQTDLAQLAIQMDSAMPATILSRVLTLGRSSKLTGYDACYLELVLRTGSILATFDRQLADAVRKAGGRVLGDPA